MIKTIASRHILVPHLQYVLRRPQLPLVPIWHTEAFAKWFEAVLLRPITNGINVCRRTGIVDSASGSIANYEDRGSQQAAKLVQTAGQIPLHQNISKQHPNHCFKKSPSSWVEAELQSNTFRSLLTRILIMLSGTGLEDMFKSYPDVVASEARQTTIRIAVTAWQRQRLLVKMFRRPRRHLRKMHETVSNPSHVIICWYFREWQQYLHTFFPLELN
ncbi:hypothetical protein K503DRAFT_858220 [Rhizopogon vinicolor AM-OR11-026]|uniref:Uncharacterized protein n=1 Tax=Rhizopogon vinicolor AM-OR11-026 TaxID=1314800 RepID=A0A1B7MU35_9AGAM|nr:hypothetical protein K503DRAFT_858220 [Rhizopogon vinicolor AM-OR11-026]